MKRDKKGFTLIELLSLIVLLSILLLIVGPNVANRVHSARVQAYINSLKNICSSAKMSEHNSRIQNYKTFNLTLDKEDGGLNIEGRKPDEGILYIYSDGSMELTARYDEFCFYKERNDEEIYEYDCSTIKKETYLAGCGTVNKPYLIEKIEDWVVLSQAVDGTLDESISIGNSSCSTKTDVTTANIKVSRNLDFNLNSSYFNSNRTDFGDINENGVVEPLITELTTEKGFNPVGDSSHKFSGNFDGNEKSLLNLHIDRTDTSYVGLFSYASKSTIYDYSIRNANVNGNHYVGILAGAIDGDSNSTISTRNVSISGINVSGDVNSSGSIVGGIAGMILYNNVSNLNSNSTVIIDGSTLTSDDPSYIGGLIGFFQSSSIDNSSSLGEVINNRENCVYAYVGGLIGLHYNSDIESSYSSTAVKNYCGYYVGGFIGSFLSDESNTHKLSNSYSTGEVVNMGSVRSETIDPYCSNCGYTGGLLGAVYNYDIGLINIYSSYSTSDVTSNILNYTGGLIGGSDGSKINLFNLYSSGNVVSNGSEYLGGFVGFNYLSTIYNCYSTSNIVSGSKQTDINSGKYLGGFVGYSNGTIKKSYSLGNITTYNGSYIGGFIGECFTCTLSDVYAAGNVVGTDKLGHLLGVYYDSSGYEQTVPSSFTNSYYISTQTVTTDGTTAATLNSNTSSYGTPITPTRAFFETTLSLGSTFKYYDNAYPLLYKLSNDDSSKVIDALIKGQKEIGF